MIKKCFIHKSDIFSFSESTTDAFSKPGSIIDHDMRYHKQEQEVKTRGRHFVLHSSSRIQWRYVKGTSCYIQKSCLYIDFAFLT
jgi:hypothetical protein